MNRRMKWPSQTRTVHSIAACLLFCLAADCQHRQPNGCLKDSGSPTDLSIDSSWCRVIRAIEDPATRQHWLLVRDLRRPGAPALLVKMPANFSTSGDRRSKPQTADLPVIRQGDRLVVSEKTAVSEGRFDATALTAAAAGEPLTVRLKLGGAILHALATAPGRAMLVTGRSEVR
jgi:hypothetical protein